MNLIDFIRHLPQEVWELWWACAILLRSCSR